MSESGPSLSGRVAVVTGASRGIGRSIANAFACADAAAVVITASRESDELLAAVDAIARAATVGRVLGVAADVTDAEACEAVIGRIAREFGRVDILVNNAAKGAKFASNEKAPFWKADSQGWRLIIDTNVNGPFHMARAVVPHMLERNWGRIINISKNVDSMTERFGTPYGPSKAALDAMSLSWAQDLHGTGITVNTLAPGGQTDTDFGTPAGRAAARAAGRLLSPDVVVPAALWLASDASSEFSGCRFVGRLWNTRLPPQSAAAAALEAPAFRKPHRQTLLDKAWP